MTGPLTGQMKKSEYDKLLAGVQFIERTGASRIQIRYSDDEDPTVWFVVAFYDGNNPSHHLEGYETDSAISPVQAVLRLCERLADGGQCSYCHRKTAFEPNSLDTMPFDQFICWYQYDPELKKFRRSCE